MVSAIGNGLKIPYVILVGVLLCRDGSPAEKDNPRYVKVG